MNLIRAFTEHPASVGESYGEHLGRAVCFGTRMVLAGIACLVHGVLPFLFVRTGSQAIKWVRVSKSVVSTWSAPAACSCS